MPQDNAPTSIMQYGTKNIPVLFFCIIIQRISVSSKECTGREFRVGNFSHIISFSVVKEIVIRSEIENPFFKYIRKPVCFPFL